MEDSYNIFKQIIRNSKYENTYKMAWAKSLVELSTQLNLEEDNIKILFSDIAKKIVKYYWNQTIFFNLRQGSNPIKPPLILTYVKLLIQEYFKLTYSNIPELYEKAEIKFKEIDIIDLYNEIIIKIINVLKKDVSWRFTFLNGINTQIYNYSKRDDFIIINSSLVNSFKKNQQDLYDLINYKWGLILETFNDSPRINKKVKIMEYQLKKKFIN